MGTLKSPVEKGTILKREVSRVSCERGTSVSASVEAEGIVVTVAGLEAFMEAEGATTAQQLQADRYYNRIQYFESLIVHFIVL